MSLRISSCISGVEAIVDDGACADADCDAAAGAAAAGRSELKGTTTTCRTTSFSLPR